MANKVTVYTDGAARGNPGPAGWGAVFLMDGKEFEIGGRSDHATNNIMELTGAIEALAYILDKKISGEVEVVSDSKYVILGITEWIPNWIRNGWRNAAKKPVMNRELWEKLYELNKELKPKWSYVKGHFENKHNERADVIATSFADKEPVELKNFDAR
jgi:ribonuclease HI